MDYLSSANAIYSAMLLLRDENPSAFKQICVYMLELEGMKIYQTDPETAIRQNLVNHINYNLQHTPQITSSFYPTHEATNG